MTPPRSASGTLAAPGPIPVTVPDPAPAPDPAPGLQVRRAAPDPDRARADERRQLERVRADLVREFAGRLGEQEVQRRFAEAVARFEGAPIRSFVPVLAQRRARLELSAAPDRAAEPPLAPALSPAAPGALR